LGKCKETSVWGARHLRVIQGNTVHQSRSKTPKNKGSAGLSRKFHATITDEKALKFKLVMVQEAAELVGRPRENK
jgi:hypothetical protein